MSQPETQTITKPRYFFVDVIRLLSMVAIIQFHIHEATFFDNAHHTSHGWLENYLEPYTRFMAFSGFSIVLISYFMIGLIGLSKRKLKQIFVIAIIGALLIFVIFGENKILAMEWDIYHFIGVASLFIALLSKSKTLLYTGSLLGIFVLLLPAETWSFPFLQNEVYYNAVFGSYHVPGKGSWPLFPWLGLPLSSYGVGYFIRHNPKILNRLSQLTRTEFSLWLALLLLSSPQWGDFYNVQVGSGFYKFVHQIDRLSLFSHLILVVFCLRLGFVKKINQWAHSNKLVSWVSRIYLNKKFFLFYFVSWILIGFFSQFDQFYINNPPVFDLVFFGLFPLTELTCASLNKGLSKMSAFWQTK